MTAEFRAITTKPEGSLDLDADVEALVNKYKAQSVLIVVVQEKITSCGVSIEGLLKDVDGDKAVAGTVKLVRALSQLVMDLPRMIGSVLDEAGYKPPRPGSDTEGHA